jgi:hypothetical protein
MGLSPTRLTSKHRRVCANSNLRRTLDDPPGERVLLASAQLRSGVHAEAARQWFPRHLGEDYLAPIGRGAAGSVHLGVEYEATAEAQEVG